MLQNLKNDVQNGLSILGVRPFFWVHRPHFAQDRPETTPRSILDRFWSDFGSNFGQILVGSWTDLGSTLDRFVKQLLPCTEMSLMCNPTHVAKKKGKVLKRDACV